MRRSDATVLTSAVRRFLAKPRTARLATIGADGYPHLVPIWFTRVGDTIVFATDRGERKVRNALANPRGAVVIGGDPGVDKAGYMIQGDLAVEADPNQALARRIIRRYHAEQEQGASEWGGGDAVIIRLNPKRVMRVA